MNQEWHKSNPLSEKATLAQKIAWHKVHAEECACRPIPEKIQEEIDKLGREILKNMFN